MTVSEVVDLFGPRLTRHLTSGCDPGTAEARLRAAADVLAVIQARAGMEVACAWMIGMNPLLGDRAPLAAIIDGRYEEVLDAACAYE